LRNYIQQSKIDDRLNTEINHEEIFYKEGTKLRSIGFTSDGVMFDRGIDKERFKKYIFSRIYSGIDTQKLREDNQNYNKDTYFVFGKNCQDFCDYKYDTLVKDK